MTRLRNELMNGRKSCIIGPVTSRLSKQNLKRVKVHRKDSSTASRLNFLILVNVKAAKEMVYAISHGRAAVVFPVASWLFRHCRKRGRRSQSKKIINSYLIVKMKHTA